MFVTADFLGAMGPSRVDSFLRGQSPVLERIVSCDGAPAAAAQASCLIYGTAQELPAMAVAQGVQDRASLACLSILCGSVFAEGGVGWPTPIRQIGRVVSGQDGHEPLSWAMVALPLGCELLLNGQTNEAMTSSLIFDQRVLVTPDTRDLVIQAGERGSWPVVTTYLGGNLWQDREWLLPAVVLHEASHRVNFEVLGSWMDQNAARPAERQDPAFSRHCVRGADGSYRVDLGFATLFLELAACLATGHFFQAILGLAVFDAAMPCHRMDVSLGVGAKYMTDPLYAPYLEQAGIPPPDLEDPSSIADTMQKFVAMVSRESAAMKS